MSPRAAWRLERLGFAAVYRYAGAIADWRASGLPVWERAPVLRIANVVRRDVPTCGPDDTVATARARAATGGWPDCVVVNDAQVVLGVLRPRALAGDATLRAEDAMIPGPVTYRLDERADKVAERLVDRGITRGLVTTPDGELVGMFFVDDIRGARPAEEERSYRPSKRA